MLRQKAKADPPFCTSSHQRGTSASVTEADHTFKIMQRNPAQLTLFLQQYDILSVQRQIYIRRRDI